jgi:hypothetical protein
MSSIPRAKDYRSEHEHISAAFRLYDLSEEEVSVKNLPGFLMLMSARLKGWFGPKNGYNPDPEWLIISNRLRVIGHSFDRPYNDADAEAMLERLHAELAMYQMREHGSAETARLKALGAAGSGPLALQHRLRQQAAIPDRIIDAGRAVHQGVGPPGEPAINPDGEDGDRPEADDHGTRRSRSTSAKVARMLKNIFSRGAGGRWCRRGTA